MMQAKRKMKNRCILNLKYIALLACSLCGWGVSTMAKQVDDIIPDGNQIVYVTQDGRGDGSSWESATSNLQAAINADHVRQVWVAEGIYQPAVGEAFKLVNNVEVYGGFHVDDANTFDKRNWRAYETILQGNGNGVVLNQYTEDHPLTRSAVLDGFTITGGEADDSGGGVYNMHASPVLRNLVIKGNHAAVGGGVANVYANPILVGVTIAHNTVDNVGGGMYNQDAYPMLTNVTIVANTADHTADGMCNLNSSSPTLHNCIVWSRGNGYPVLSGLAEIKGSHNLIEGGHNTNIEPYKRVTGRLSASDIFVDDVSTTGGESTTGVDFRLKVSSPAVNAGNNEWLAEALEISEDGLATVKDLAGNPRVMGQVVDLGAYELAPPQPGEGNILYVDQDAPLNSDGSGNSWMNAIPRLQDALAWAKDNEEQWTAANPLQIWVAEGAYELEEGQFFTLINHVEIYGGFRGYKSADDNLDERDWKANKTILKGNGNSVIRNEYTRDNPLTNAAVLDGFTIAGGNATTGSGGGGVYNEYSSPSLTNLVISDNEADRGGGMYNSNSSPVLTNVMILGNRASGSGGGMYSYSSSPSLTNVAISDNEALSGGGMCNYAAFPVLTNVMISGNSVERNGGGMYSYSNSSVILVNTTVADNKVTDSGMVGGIYTNEGSTLTLQNSIVWNNTKVNGSVDNLYAPRSTMYISHSLLQGNTTQWQWDTDHTGNGAESGNIITETSPFVDVEDDFRLKVGSPAINAGNNEWLAEALGLTEDELLAKEDSDGNLLVQGGTIDLGAYESPYDNLASVEDGEAITVDFGTLLSEISLPEGYTVTGTLAGGTTVELAVDDDTGNWELVDADEDDYDGNIAGDYVFEVPLILPDPEDEDRNWFSNTQGLKTRITVTVAKGNPKLTVAWGGTPLDPADGLSLTYGDVGKLEAMSTNPDGRVTFTFDDGEEDVLDLTDPEEVAANRAGTATLTVAQEETANYEAASLSLEVTVAPKAITIVPAAGQGKVYGEADPDTYGYELAEGETLAFDDELADIVSATAREAGEDVGEYAIILELEGAKADNYAVTSDAEHAAFAITPLAVTVTAGDATKVYGEEDPALTYSYAPELVDGDTFTGGLTRELGEDAGSYAITQGDLSLSDNYTLTFGAGTLTIERAQPVITVAAEQTHVYDGSAKAVVASVVPAELAGQLQYSPQGSFTDVGEHRVRVYLNGSANYLPAEAYVDFSITPAGQEDVALPDLTVTYTGQPHALSVVGLPADATVVYTINGEEGNSATDAGSYEVTATVTRPNYADEMLTGTLYINKATAEITAAAEQVHTYDGMAKAVQATLNHSETVLTYTPQQGYTDAGTYRVTIAADETANYHAAAAGTVTLRIEPAAQTGLELPSRTVTYTGRPHALPVTGLPAAATVVYTINGEEGNSATDAGSYEVTATVTRPNYADETLKGVLTIGRAPSYILGEENQVHVYDGTAKSLAVELSHDEGELAYAPGNSFTAAGTYTVTVSAPQTDNYEAVSKTFTLRIDRAERTLTFPALPVKTYGDAAFNAGATTSSGEAVSYTSSNPAVAEVAADGTITITGAGETTITATVPESDNYTSRPSMSRTLTVAKAAQAITFAEVGELRRDAGTVPLSVSASSGLPVALAIDDEEVATLSGTSLTILRLGTVRITATQVGDANHEPAEPVTVTVRVTDPTADLPVRVTKAVSPNGDGINEYLVIEAIKDYPDNRVTIFNRNGTVIWEASGYNNGTVAFRGIGTGQNNVPAGTYFYVAEIRVNGEWKYEKGWFVLRY